MPKKKHENSLVAVLPADHHVDDKQAFIDTLITGIEYAEAGKLVTFGVQPNRAETGYGYIEVKEIWREGVLEVLKFQEKPDAVLANEYFLSGRHFWNAGIFLFKPSTIIELAEKVAVETANLVRSSVDSIELEYGYHSFGSPPWSKIRTQSFDHAICEHASNIAYVPINHCWNDLGDWKSLVESREIDVNKNIFSKNTTGLDCKNTLLLSETNRIHLAAVGVENIVAVVTDDAVLVANKDRLQEVKNVVEVMDADNVTQSSQHKKDYRP